MAGMARRLFDQMGEHPAQGQAVASPGERLVEIVARGDDLVGARVRLSVLAAHRLDGVVGVELEAVPDE